ncbi:peptidylprolyl isomerase [Morganella morganii]|nr:peptidylprolyl isomerase [Morganella morganii]
MNLFKHKKTALMMLMTGTVSVLALSGCSHSAGKPSAAATSSSAQVSSPAVAGPEQHEVLTPEQFATAGLNIERNRAMLAEIKKQHYVRYDDNIYFKILKQGKTVPAAAMAGKVVTFTLNETLTDGSVTLSYDKTKPLVVPFNQLPQPLNVFVALAGEAGKVKFYVKPEGGYGKAGIPGKIPPESMSVITIEVLNIK